MKKIPYAIALLFLFIFMACSDDEDCSCEEGIYGKWEATHFMSMESVSYPKESEYNPTVAFLSNGSVELQLDVNGCFGDFEVAGENTIQISEMACTEACCDSPFSEKLVEMLSQVGSYEIDKNTLKLFVSNWGWIEFKRISD